MIKLAVVGVTVALVAVLFGVGPAAPGAGAASELLPNLQALAASEIRIEQVGKKRRLRFTTTSQNAGAAALELQGGEVVNGKSKQRVYQHVMLDSGGFKSYLVGEFVYHPGHKHFHLERYADYTLRPADSGSGLTPRSGTKTSFCIMDTDHLLPYGPGSAVYGNCGGSLQGMSVGWGDRYRYYLAGQEIDITSLRDGDYRLEIHINPVGLLRESTLADNLSSVNLRIVGSTVTLP